MLSETFLRRLDDAFPSFYERVNQEAVQDAREILKQTGGDVEKALLRTRFAGAGRLWWPYVKGSIPLVGNPRPAMEGFSRLVLTVDHVVGYQPQSMEEARSQVVEVLRNAVDVERLRTILDGKSPSEAEAAAQGAAAGAGLLASATALLAPLTTVGRMRRSLRFIPAPLRMALGAVVVATLLSVPLVAGYTAGMKAQESALRQAPGAKGAGGKGGG